MKLINHINILKTREEFENQPMPDHYVIRKIPSNIKEVPEYSSTIKEESCDLQESLVINQDANNNNNNNSSGGYDGKKNLDIAVSEEINRPHQETEDSKRILITLQSDNDMQGCISGGENAGEFESIGDCLVLLVFLK